MISGDSKGINNRHVGFDSITSSEKPVMDTALLWQEMYDENFD